MALALALPSPPATKCATLAAGSSLLTRSRSRTKRRALARPLSRMSRDVRREHYLRNRDIYIRRRSRGSVATATRIVRSSASISVRIRGRLRRDRHRRPRLRPSRSIGEEAQRDRPRDAPALGRVLREIAKCDVRSPFAIGTNGAAVRLAEGSRLDRCDRRLIFAEYGLVTHVEKVQSGARVCGTARGASSGNRSSNFLTRRARGTLRIIAVIAVVPTGASTTTKSSCVSQESTQKTRAVSTGLPAICVRLPKGPSVRRLRRDRPGGARFRSHRPSHKVT